MRSTPPRHRLTAISFAAALLVVSACSDSAEPDIFEATDPVDVTSVAVTSADRWGTGYAVAAHPLADDRMAVVTTAGVYLTDGSGDEAREIEAFGGPAQVQTSAVSPDGSVLVVATNTPATVRWYDLVEGQPTAALDVGVDGTVREFAFVDATNRLVAVTSTGVVSWDRSAPDAAATPLAEGQIGPIARLDGRIAAPVLDTTELIITDGVTVDRRSIALPEGATLSIASASPDGGTLGVTSGLGSNEFERTDAVHVIDLATMAPTATIEYDRPIRPLEFAITSSVVATSDGAELTINRLSGETITSASPLPDDPIQSVLATDAGIATVHRSGAVVAWTADEWAPSVLGQGNVTLRFAGAHGADITSVDFDGGITTWGIDDGSRTDDQQFATGEATASAVSTDGGRIAVATVAGIAVVLDDDLAEQATLVVEGRSPRIDTVEFNPESAEVVTGLAERLGDLAFDDSVNFWDEDTGTPTVTIGGESEDVAGCSFFVNRVGFTPDGTLMSTVSHDFSIGIHDGVTGDYIVTLEPFASSVLDTDFSRSGDLLVASSDDSSVKVWDTEDFELLTSYVAAPGGLQALELLPDDSTLVASDLSGRLIVMDIMSGEILEVIAELGSRTSAIALSDDGGVVAAPFGDGTVGLWSTTSGEQLTTLTGHSGVVTDLDFGPGDDWLVTASRDGTIRKWDLDTTTS